MPKVTRRNGAGRGSRTNAVPGDSARQAEIVDIAARLFAQQGYAATTVRDIADEAGILSGSLYHHFTSKEDMVDAILSAFLDGMIVRYDEILAAGLAPRAAIEQLVAVSLTAIEDQRNAIVIYQNEGRFLARNPRFAYLDAAAGRFREAWVTTIERGIESGALRAEIDPRLVYRFVRDAVWAAARWYRPGGDVTTRTLADQYLRMILDGIAVQDRLGRHDGAT